MGNFTPLSGCTTILVERLAKNASGGKRGGGEGSDAGRHVATGPCPHPTHPPPVPLSPKAHGRGSERERERPRTMNPPCTPCTACSVCTGKAMQIEDSYPKVSIRPFL